MFDCAALSLFFGYLIIKLVSGGMTATGQMSSLSLRHGVRLLLDPTADGRDSSGRPGPSGSQGHVGCLPERGMLCKSAD